MGNRAPHVTEKKKEKKGKKKSMLVKDMGFRIIGTEKGNSDLSRTDMGFGGEGIESVDLS